MDEAREVLIHFDDGLITAREAEDKLLSMASRQEIPMSVAVGFILDIKSRGQQCPT